jgi:hypothetical protein
MQGPATTLPAKGILELFDSYLCNSGRLGDGNAQRQPRTIIGDGFNK